MIEVSKFVPTSKYFQCWLKIAIKNVVREIRFFIICHRRVPLNWLLKNWINWQLNKNWRDRYSTGINEQTTTSTADVMSRNRIGTAWAFCRPENRGWLKALYLQEKARLATAVNRARIRSDHNDPWCTSTQRPVSYLINFNWFVPNRGQMYKSGIRLIKRDFATFSRRNSRTERETSCGKSRGIESTPATAHQNGVKERERSSALATATLPRTLRDQLRSDATSKATDHDQATTKKSRNLKSTQQRGSSQQGQPLQNRCLLHAIWVQCCIHAKNTLQFSSIMKAKRIVHEIKVKRNVIE